MKAWKKRFIAALPGLAVDLFAVAGGCLICRGISDIYPPAGLIAAGVFCIVAAVLIGKGGGGG